MGYVSQKILKFSPKNPEIRKNPEKSHPWRLHVLQRLHVLLFSGYIICTSGDSSAPNVHNRKHPTYVSERTCKYVMLTMLAQICVWLHKLTKGVTSQFPLPQQKAYTNAGLSGGCSPTSRHTATFIHFVSTLQGQMNEVFKNRFCIRASQST